MDHVSSSFLSVHNSRREVLRAGGLAGLGLTLSSVLRGEAAAASSRAGGPTTAVRAKSVILLWLQGGVSHHETFDPKPHASEEIRGIFDPIATNLPGVQIGEHMPRLAQMLDKLAVVRSVTHGESAHQRGCMYMVAGRRPPANVGNEDINTDPDMGSFVAHQLGMRGGLPAYVSIPGSDFTSKFTGRGWLPHATRPFKGIHAEGLTVPSGTDSQRFTERVALRDGLTRSAQTVGSASVTSSWDEFDNQAMEIITSSAASRAFDYLSEPQSVLDLYGAQSPKKGKGGVVRLQLPELCVQARRLVEAGVRYVTIGRDSWDHHSNIFPQIKGRVPRFDNAFAGLVTDLEQRGRLDDTLVVYLTEFGRTPKVNKDKGRDHWPRAFSVAFAGAGIKPGQVLGASDSDGGDVADFPVTPEQIAATILSLAGIHPQTEFIKTDGRPIAYVEKAQPIARLLA